ncbi:hypothetical protein GTP23_00690 [Pseudoduganella sp. FT93W]|uniref:Uncharacterized protein n=1 Tax=Duganella fentianensis TaxID=2692177 RepID=A0A845HVM9_9BURK|nr:hypothetical protein [Duganella fentianensis]MYN43581.1 hypothetical protein [Duganella fentianensis]
MKISLPAKILGGIWMSCLTVLTHSQDLSSTWRLRVANTDNQIKAEATIRFSNETARSCMAGTWKRVLVETKAAQAEEFFPLAGPLAYKLENGALTLGRTEVCDGFLFLSGKAEAQVIHGSYDAIGWGSRKLGSFSLQQMQ